MITFCSILLGILATALSFGWIYVMETLSFIPQTLPTGMLIGIAVAIFLAMVFLSSRSKKLVAIPSFLLLWPLLIGGVKHFANNGLSEMFSLSIKQYAIALGSALLLILIYEVIMSAIDREEHPFVVWVTEAFFLVLIIGSYYLLEKLVTVGFASVFTHAAFMLFYSNSMARSVCKACFSYY